MNHLNVSYIGITKICVSYFTALKSKLLQWSDSCIRSFGRFPGARTLRADVSEHSVPPSQAVWTRHMKLEQTGCYEKSAHKTLIPRNHPKERIQHIYIITVVTWSWTPLLQFNIACSAVEIPWGSKNTVPRKSLILSTLLLMHHPYPYPHTSWILRLCCRL